MLIISHRSHQPIEVGASVETRTAADHAGRITATLSAFFHRLVAFARMTPEFHNTPEQRIERANFMAHRDQVRSETFFR